jgi:hypothetical protein
VKKAGVASSPAERAKKMSAFPGFLASSHSPRPVPLLLATFVAHPYSICRVAPARARRNSHVQEGLLEEAGSVSHDRYQPRKEQYRYQQQQHRYTGAGKLN